MTVRAKFKCRQVTRNESGYDEVKLSAVTGADGADDPNASWSKYTPIGELSMTITNPDAVGQFEPGVEYYLDITKAED